MSKIIPAWILGILALVRAKECTFSVELLQLQDASGSFQEYVDKMRKITMELIQALSAKYENFHMGLAGFVDKPLPFRGIGNFGANTFAPDWCYRLFTPMTQNASLMEAALGDLMWNMGSGGDLPENPLEALIFGALDQSAGWTDQYEEKSEAQNVVRIILLVTDDRAHQPTEADDGTARGWNWPRSYPSGPNGNSQGGFGAHSFIDSRLFAESAKYNRMADLFRLYDNNLTMTTQEYDELLTLIEYYGPYPWPKVQPHPGDNSQPACELTEYPTIEQTAKVLQMQNVLPIFLVPEDSRNLLDYYTGLAHQLEVLTVVAPMDLDRIFENIVDAVTSMTQAVCEAPSTTRHPRPSTTTTTSHPPLTNPPIVIPTRTPPSTPAPPAPNSTLMPMSELVTTLHTHSQMIGGSSSEHKTPQSEAADVTTTAIDESDDRTTSFSVLSTTDHVESSTSTYKPLNPIPERSQETTEEEKGSATGVIIGATTGAIVGVGAVAGGVYAALGTNFLGTPQTIEDIDTNVGDAPTESLERERLEQVTMDMFH